MGIFDERPFDFDHDGEEDPIETMVGLQMFAGSRREAIELTGETPSISEMILLTI